MNAGAHSLLAVLGRAGSRLLDVVYPRICPVCGEKSDRPGRNICWKCFSSLPLYSVDMPHCVRCGKVPDGAVEKDFLCDVCRQSPPAFDLARTAMPFRSCARDVIHTLKYRSGIWLKEDLADILEGCARAHYAVAAIDLVLPVPLNPDKFRKRNYNQSALLAGSLAGRLGLPYMPSVISRPRFTSTQTHLSVTGRKKNVKGAFEITRPEFVRGRTVLVIGDVMTTGATLGEVAAVLKAAGAWRVWALAVARD